LGDRSNSAGAKFTTAGMRQLNGKADQIQRVPRSVRELSARALHSGAAFFDMVAEPAV
jgi:hypothetical protein